MGCCGDCCVPPEEYREPLRHDPDFDGPVRHRSCTDVVWLILFILFLGAWGFVGYYGVTHGDVERLLAPMDSRGRRCGLDSEVEDKKYLVFFNIAKCLVPTTPISGCPTPQVCVKGCPTATKVFTAPEYTESNFNAWKSSMVCVSGLDPNAMTHAQAVQYIKQEQCASYVLNSQPVLQRCFINVTEAVLTIEDFRHYTEEEIAKDLNNLLRFKELSSQIVQDLVQSRWYMAGALFAVVLLCFLYILVLRWVVTPVVWASIVGLLALLGFSCYLCFKQYVYFRDNPAGLYQTSISLKGVAQSMFSKHQTWLALLVLLAVVLLVLLLIVIFLRNRITIAIALIREGSKAVIDIKSTVLFPIFPWVIQCFVIAYGVVVLMYLLSIGESAFRVVDLKNDTNCDCGGFYQDQQSCSPEVFLAKCRDSVTLGSCATASCHFSGLDSPTSVVYLHLVNLLGFFWAMFFISGVADMILASTFSTWYWTFDKRNVPFWTLTSGISRTLCYHLGTVAFGALIIAIVRVIRILLEYLDHKLKKFDNPFTRCVLCCCKCFFWCLENFLKFINKNAYIMCAVHGKNFCTSAREAFSLLMRNIIRVVVLDKVTDFIFFLSKLLLSIGVGFAVYYLLEWSFVYEVTQGGRLHYNYVPAVILGIATYLISTIFFNVYAMAVDTLFLCFLEDCERNDGSPEKKYYMSKNLMKILGKRNKKE